MNTAISILSILASATLVACLVVALVKTRKVDTGSLQLAAGLRWYWAALAGAVNRLGA